MTLKDFKNIHTAKIVVGVHSYAWHGSKSTPVFLPTDGEGSWLLFSSLVSLLSSGLV